MIQLELTSRTDPNYKDIRDRHYVPNHGCIGRQLHYLIRRDSEIVGIISGASAVWACKPRDDFFGITKDNRRERINEIINNVVFRLEKTEHNLASQILSIWRKQCKRDWLDRYNSKAIGFETFIYGENRTGVSYKADNWVYLGETKGNTKFHPHGAYNPGQRIQTNKKLIFAHK